MSTLLTTKEYNKVLNFSDSESQSQAQQIQVEKNKQLSKIQNLNPQRQTVKIKNQQFLNNYSTVEPNQLKKQTKNSRSQVSIKLRRNSAYKVKKINQKNDADKSIFYQSVTKFKNIFQQAEQINFNAEKILAIHEQNNHKQVQPFQKSVRQNLKKPQMHLIKSIQKSPVLKLSDVLKKPKLSIHESQLTSKMMRTTCFTEQPMKQYLQNKLNQKLAINQPKYIQKQKKIRLKLDQIKNFVEFAHKKIPKNYVLFCKLKKNTNGLNYIWPQFHLNDFHSNIHILSGKKKSGNTTSNYYISTNQKEIDVQNQNYTGKLRSNFLGSCFNIFNQGANPQNGAKGEDKIRKLLSTVIYQSQITNANPKELRVYMIKQPYTYYQLQGTNIKEQETSLQQLYEIGQNKFKIAIFKNRKPTYNKKQNKFVLNFGGRIKRPSTKNFILQDCQTKKQVMMFGKIDQGQYVMYISNPLTPHIAMSIALAQLDNKIICD